MTLPVAQARDQLDETCLIELALGGLWVVQVTSWMVSERLHLSQNPELVASLPNL